MISIRDLSKELGRNENKFHQFIKKNNYPIDKIKLDDKKYRGQTVSVVSDEIADEIRELLKDNSMNVKNQKSRFGGYFYVIQLEPILDPNRIKLGFAVDAQERLRRHQCLHQMQFY